MSRSFDRKALFRLDYEEVFSEAIRALEDCGFEVKYIDRSSGSITATAHMSFWSGGETIKVTVSATNGEVQVDAQSKVKMPTQVTDWGRNESNINEFFSTLGRRTIMKKAILDYEKALDEKEKLLRRASHVLNSIIKELDDVDVETRQKIMELCGEACAREDGDLEIAERIARETADEEEILYMVNKEISWCGTWARDGDTIQTTCTRCGCPLVRNRIVHPAGTFCYCSRGWVKSIFETVLKKSVSVELEKSIGCGDKICKFVIHI